MFVRIFLVAIIAPLVAEAALDPEIADEREANFWELGLIAAQRSFSGGGELATDISLAQWGDRGRRDMRSVCGRGGQGRARGTRRVTVYYVPLLKKFNAGPCHRMEGVCRFWKDGREYIANYGKPSVPLSAAFCKNGIGYGLTRNCTHPCRSLAASTRHHRGGEVIFFPDLVGKSCGTGKNKMVHDGFMVVNDTGHPKHFNAEGRFDFFWGECRRFRNGVCLDAGAREMSAILSGGRFCRAWRPHDPFHNSRLKTAVMNAVRTEAIVRGDIKAAAVFDLDVWNANSHAEAGRRLAKKASAARLAAAR